MTQEELDAIMAGLGTGPRPLTEPELQFLTDADREYIKQLDAKHGAGSERSYRYWSDQTVEKLGDMQRGVAVPTPESAGPTVKGHVRPHRGEDVDLEAEEDAAVARIKKSLMAQGMPAWEASVEANRQVMYWMSLPRTIGGEAQSFVGADPASALETSGMSDMEVLWESLKPQKLPTQKAQKESAHTTRRAAMTRYQMWRVAYEQVAAKSVEAAKRAPAEPPSETAIALAELVGKDPYAVSPDIGLDPRVLSALQNMSGHGGQLYGHLKRQGLSAEASMALTKEIKEAHGIVVENYLEGARAKFESEALQGIQIQAKEQGEALSEEQAQAEAKDIGQAMYDIYESEVFPHIVRERKDTVTPEQIEADPTFLPWVDPEAASRQLTYTNYLNRSRREAQGPLVESFAQAGMRDLVGLVRIATDPAIDAISYEVDEHGKPVDTSDWNYRFAMAHNDLLADGGFGAFLGSIPVALMPMSLVRDPYAGAERDEDGKIVSLSPRMRISTGNWIRDVSVSIARGRHLGDDFMELGETTAMYSRLGVPEAPMWIGLATEIGLPITPIPLVKTPVRALARGTVATIRTSADTLGSVSRIVDSSGVVGGYVKAVGAVGARPFEFMASPTAWARQQTIYRDSMAAIRSTGKKPKLVERVSIMDEARLPNAMAARIGSDMAVAQIRGVTFKAPQGTSLARTVQLVKDADRMLRQGLADTKVYAEMKKNPLGQTVIDHYTAARMAGFQTGSNRLRHQVLSNIAKDAMRETFAHSIPNNFIMVAENVVVPVATWNKVKKTVQEKARKILDQTPIADEVLYRNGSQVAKLLDEVLGTTKADVTPFWSGVRSKLINGKALTGAEAASVHTMAVAGLVKGEVTGAVQLKYAGEAYKTGKAAAARAESVAREPLVRTVKEILKGTSDALMRAKPRGLQVEAHASTEVQGLVTTINERLTQLDREYIRYVRGQRKISSRMLPQEGATGVKPSGIRGISNQQYGETLRSNPTGRFAAEHIVKNADSASYRAIAQRIIPHIDDVNVRVVGLGDSAPSMIASGRARGLNQVIAGKPGSTVWIRGIDDSSSGLNTETVLHELLHAATAARLEDARLLKNKGTQLQGAFLELNDLTGIVIKEWRKSWKAGKPVGPSTINLDELLAWGMTNKEFQAFLQGIKINKKQTAFDKFVNTVAALLGISTKERTALTEVIRLTDDILKSPLDELAVRKWTGTGTVKATKTSPMSVPGNATTQRILDDLGSGETVDDLLEIATVFFGRTALAPIDMAGLRVIFEARFAGKPLTTNLVIDAIGAAREAHPVLSKAGVKTRGVSAYSKEAVAARLETKKLLRTDEPDVALHSWLMDKYKSRVMDEVLQPFYAKNPELMIRLGGDDAADAVRFRSIAQSRNIPRDIVNKVVPVIYRGLGDASALDPAHFHQLIEDILSEMYTHGTLAAMSPSMRTGEAITNRLLSSKIARISSLRPRIEAVISAKYPRLVGHTEDLVKDILSVMIESSTGATLDRLVGQLRAMGVSIPAGRIADLGDSLKPMVMRLESDMAVLIPSGLLTSEEIKVTQQLIGASASGKLWTNLRDINKVDSQLANEIGYTLKHKIELTRRMAVSGLLGGFPLPGVRHGALNAVSAPFIAAVTTPRYVGTVLRALIGNPLTGGAIGKATFRALESAMGQNKVGTKFFNKAHNMHKGPNDVVMIDDWGRKWTKSRLQESVDSQNTMFTQTQFEFRDKVMDDIRRAVAQNPNLRNAGWVKQIWRYLNPANKNLWGMIVHETDVVFREAVYVESLRRGMTEAQSAVIARNVLLDYGALTAWERDFASRGLLFYAFQRQMTLEVMKSFLRDGDSLQILRGTMAGIKAQHEEAGTWMFEPDYMRSRLWSYIGKDFDEVHTAHAGADIPSIQTFNMLANAIFTGWDFYNSMSSEDGEARYMPRDLAKGFYEEFQATPAISAAFDLATIRGPRTKDQREVDARWVQFFMDAGMWDTAVWAFDVRKRERLPGPKPGTPTIGGDTYYFHGAGYEWWLLFEYATLVSGVQRNIRDYTQIKMKAGEMPEDTELKYMGEGNWVLYSLALDTSYKLPTEAQVYMRSAAQIQQELQALK